MIPGESGNPTGAEKLRSVGSAILAPNLKLEASADVNSISRSGPTATCRSLVADAKRTAPALVLPDRYLRTIIIRRQDILSSRKMDSRDKAVSFEAGRPSRD